LGEGSVAALEIEGPSGAEERFAPLDDGRVRFIQAGSGSPLVLLHGLLGYSFSWRLNLAALAQHRRVLALDQLGVGFSDHPQGWIALCAQSRAEPSLLSTSKPLEPSICWAPLTEAPLPCGSRR